MAQEAPLAPDEGRVDGAVGIDRDRLAAVVDQVVGLFPDCQRTYLEQLIPEQGWWDANVVCNFLLEDPGYPRCPVQELFLLPESSVFLREEKEAEVDYLSAAVSSAPPDPLYEQQALELLRRDFPVLMLVDLRSVLRLLKHRYALTRMVLSKAVKSWLDNGGKSQSSRGKREVIPVAFHEGSLQVDVTLRVLERRRRERTDTAEGVVVDALHPELHAELLFFEAKMRQQNEHEDLQLAMRVNEQQYEEEHQAIECGCCFGAVPFEEMTQCLDGHLFCKDCLVRYAHEAVFGQAGAQLRCMVPGCEEGFPQSELHKTLSEKILLKLSERQAEQDVSTALRDELIRCPFCDFAALLDQVSVVFVCPNPRCKKSSCRKCREDWTDHSGLSCEELKSRSQVKLRISMEERMSAARIRKCPRCGTGLLKSEGCNKLSCRCGGTLCNVCRAPDIGYEHFCQHPLVPGQPCSRCTACLLWADPEKEDDRLIERIQLEAREASGGGDTGKRIGPPLTPDEPKQRRIDDQQQHQHPPRHRNHYHHHHFGHHQHHHHHHYPQPMLPFPPIPPHLLPPPPPPLRPPPPRPPAWPAQPWMFEQHAEGPGQYLLQQQQQQHQQQQYMRLQPLQGGQHQPNVQLQFVRLQQLYERFQQQR